MGLEFCGFRFMKKYIIIINTINITLNSIVMWPYVADLLLLNNIDAQVYALNMEMGIKKWKKRLDDGF